MLQNKKKSALGRLFRKADFTVILKTMVCLGSIGGFCLAPEAGLSRAAVVRQENHLLKEHEGQKLFSCEPGGQCKKVNSAEFLKLKENGLPIYQNQAAYQKAVGSSEKMGGFKAIENKSLEHTISFLTKNFGGKAGRFKCFMNGKCVAVQQAEYKKLASQQQNKQTSFPEIPVNPLNKKRVWTRHSGKMIGVGRKNSDRFWPFFKTLKTTTNSQIRKEKSAVLNARKARLTQQKKLWETMHTQDKASLRQSRINAKYLIIFNDRLRRLDAELRRRKLAKNKAAFEQLPAEGIVSEVAAENKKTPAEKYEEEETAALMQTPYADEMAAEHEKKRTEKQKRTPERKGGKDPVKSDGDTFFDAQE